MKKWKYLPYFKRSELDCKCDSCKGKETGYKMDSDFMSQLVLARVESGIPYVINRGYSCKKHNASISGASATSEHIKGRAVDIKCFNTTQRSKIIKGLHDAGLKRIKIYERHIHVDKSKSKSKPKEWFDVKWR
jgi:hypothetical protein